MIKESLLPIWRLYPSDVEFRRDRPFQRLHPMGQGYSLIIGCDKQV